MSMNKICDLCESGIPDGLESKHLEVSLQGKRAVMRVEIRTLGPDRDFHIDCVLDAISALPGTK